MHSIYDKPIRHPALRLGRTKIKSGKAVDQLKNLAWYEPQEHSGPVHFFRDTSLHGLKYLGQRERHMCERIFWFAAFTLAVILSVILTWHKWSQYRDNPIVTIFNPSEMKLNQIPFPAVTICSVSKIRKTIYNGYAGDVLRGIEGKLEEKTLLKKMGFLDDIDHICHVSKTFTAKFLNRTFEEYESLEEAFATRHGQFENLTNTISTLRNSSQTCEEMILYCLWLDGIEDCSELFHPLATDYGQCCSFNMIPLSLLRKFSEDSQEDYERVKDWEEADLNSENLLLRIDPHNTTRKYPHRQRHPGRSAGLSFLVDPHMDEYHCTNTDSEGFVIGFNAPLNFPRMKETGIAIPTSAEMFISVHPEITISAESVKQFTLEKRRCYFEGEKKLTFYKKYSSSNCIDECIAMKTLQECGCLRYYMPRGRFKTETICLFDQYDCTVKVQADIIQGGLDKGCNECLPTCTEIHYQTETTSLQIREEQITELLKKDSHKHKNYEDLLRRAKNVSIVHVYINVDSVFPRLRLEMSTQIDLISSAGCLLGLCMGFSLLSLLEIIYHATLRLVCKFYRNREKVTKASKVEDSRKANNNMIFSTGSYGKHRNGASLFGLKCRRPSLLQSFDGKDKKLRENTLKFSRDSSQAFKKNYESGKKAMFPVVFQTPFEADFQRAYFATAMD